MSDGESRRDEAREANRKIREKQRGEKDSPAEEGADKAIHRTPVPNSERRREGNPRVD